MKESSLARIAPVLDALRAHPALEEVRLTHFLLNGRDFVHFHDDEHGIVADAILSTGRVSMPVETPAEQAEFMERIAKPLRSLGSRKRDRTRRRRAARGDEQGRP